MVTCCNAWIANGAPPAPCAAKEEAGKARFRLDAAGWPALAECRCSGCR